MITLDFETRSEADLKVVGTYEYARHPSTDIICLAHVADDDREVDLWHPGFEDLSYLQAQRKADRTQDDLPRVEDPHELWERIEDGELVEAHNAWFERCIWHFILHPRYGWPAVAHEQWRCSAARAASFALRRKLEHVAQDLGLAEQKDMPGHRVMQKLMKPRKPTKGDPDSKWHQKRADLLTVFEYCRQDVRAERALSQALPPMPAKEVEIYLLDQKINWRGIHFDRELVDGARIVGAGAEALAQQELGEITYGQVKSHGQKVAMLDWIEGEGVKAPRKMNQKKEIIRTTEAKGFEKLLEGELPEHVRRALELWLSVAKTSVKKYDAFANRGSDDDRVRESLRYHAASTGRWSGMGIQPQNLVRNVPKNLEEIVADVKTGDFDLVSFLYGAEQAQTVLSRISRGIITADAGKVLQVSDFASIEARGTFWVSGHAAGLRAFREADAGRGPEIYCWQAEQVFGYPVTRDMDKERQAGKVVVLGCGYQMGAPKLVTYAKDTFGVTLTKEEAVRAVKGYRSTNWPVVEFWGEANRCAIAAVDHPGRRIEQNEHIRWGVRGRFLHCRLPSGRLLSYLDPEIKWGKTPWGESVRKLYFSGTNTYTRKWERADTYGGKLTENIVQGLCRDLMAEAMLRAEPAGYPIILTVHDEVVSEPDEGYGSQQGYDAIMTEMPVWAKGMPIVADGFRTKRYRK